MHQRLSQRLIGNILGDLFDVHTLLNEEGINDDIRTAFLVYLISHSGSLAGVLAPKLKDITQDFHGKFAGMTQTPLPQAQLEHTRKKLISIITHEMPCEHRNFLIDFVQGSADWSDLGMSGVEKLPAVRWRERNLRQMTSDDRNDLVKDLKAVWGL